MTFEEFAAARLPALLRPAAPDPADRIDQDDLWRRLTRLPRKQRAVVVLRYYEGLTDAEIADVLGCGASTVRSHAARALATLRVSMTEPADSERGAS